MNKVQENQKMILIINSFQEQKVEFFKYNKKWKMKISMIIMKMMNQ